jgi:hypothetical protein
MPPTDSPPTPPALSLLGLISELVTRHGLATVIALVLLGFNIFGLDSRLAAAATATTKLEDKIDAHATAMSTRDAEARAHDEAALRLLLLICRHGAHDQAGRDACDAVGGAR